MRSPFATDSDMAAPADGVATVSMRSLIAARGEARRLGLAGPVHAFATRSGGHLSPVRGAGMDYDESRVYVPGDDPRTMDWRHTARAGRPHVKLFCEERERPLLLLVDQRPGMRFATRVAFKSVIAARAAALVGWAAVERGDRVGGLVFDEACYLLQRPVARQHGLLQLLRALSSAPASAPPTGGLRHMHSAVDRLLRLRYAGGVICVLSDFSDPDGADTWLSRLARRAEVILVAVHDPIEERAPPGGAYPVLTPGGRRALDMTSEARRVSYERGFQRRQRWLIDSARRCGAHWLPLRTDWPIGRSLARGLGVPRISQRGTGRG